MIEHERIGKLGGGGAPEVVEVNILKTGIFGPPAGWKKGAGVFTGEITRDNAMIFGAYLTGLPPGRQINGGGVVTGGTFFRYVSGTITWVRME